MLQYSTYSVISPEGCASILWKSADKASDAAEVMGITAERLHELELIDRVIPEPLGGAHRDIDAVTTALGTALRESVSRLSAIPIDQLLADRYQRLMQFGVYKS